MAETTHAPQPIKIEVETPYIKFWKENNILCAAYADNLHLTFDIAKHVVTSRLNYCENKSYFCFVDMRGVRSATKEAREYLAVEGTVCVIAGALLIDSVLTRTIGNIFLKVNKPRVPVRLFNNKKDAMEWLNQQLQQYRK